ncbi:hypothetical protein BCR43DRAFT_513547 [Syncephalastrum racemosum]|uniref:F-box domain-containing protein n=1 Tax=Syncephalastrum racemosum TaxID=13706 RepID=A0A1X2HK27_SYNRA|nr:hypothetical protein BCR43DRAFT_513547 [Syncephalastrum racemosum]
MFTTPYYGSKYLLAFIITRCPGIVSLHVQHTLARYNFVSDFKPLSTAPALRHLTWEGDMEFFTDPSFVSASFPDLQTLRLVYYDYCFDQNCYPYEAPSQLEPLLRVIDSLPKLVHFGYYSPGDGSILVDLDDMSPTTFGLQRLILHGLFRLSLSSLYDTLLKVSDTLTYFDYSDYLNYIDPSIDDDGIPSKMSVKLSNHLYLPLARLALSSVLP